MQDSANSSACYSEDTNNRENTNSPSVCYVYLNTYEFNIPVLRYAVLVTPVGQEISQISHGKSPSHSLGQFHLSSAEEVMQTNETYNKKKKDTKPVLCSKNVLMIYS